jgi:hypothetical protein
MGFLAKSLYYKALRQRTFPSAADSLSVAVLELLRKADPVGRLDFVHTTEGA